MSSHHCRALGSTGPRCPSWRERSCEAGRGRTPPPPHYMVVGHEDDAGLELLPFLGWDLRRRLDVA